MKIERFLLLLCGLIFCLPSTGRANNPNPNFGVSQTLNHLSNGNDQQDLIIANYTNETLEYGSIYPGDSNPDWYVLTRYSDNGWTLPNEQYGYTANLTKGQSSLTTIQWMSTKEADAYFYVTYTIGEDGPAFRLLLFPQHKCQILTDLKFAYSIMSATADGVGMMFGDGDATDDFWENIENAINEGNTMLTDAGNSAWALVLGGSDTPQSDPSDPTHPLTYPIVYQLYGKYIMGVSSNDHIAFQVGNYVVELVVVNNKSPITGNPQTTANVYTLEQWNNATQPYGNVTFNGWQKMCDITSNIGGGAPTISMLKSQEQCLDSYLVVEMDTQYEIASPPYKDGQLYYSYGIFDVMSMELNWSIASHKEWKDQNGVSCLGTVPSIALGYDPGGGKLVFAEAHTYDQHPMICTGYDPSWIGLHLIGCNEYNDEYLKGNNVQSISIALANATNIAFMYFNTNDKHFYINMGFLNLKTLEITWGQPQQFGGGITAKNCPDTVSDIALNDQYIIEVHSNFDDQGSGLRTCYCTVGTYSIQPDATYSISWWDEQIIPTPSTNGEEATDPTISIRSDGTVVATYVVLGGTGWGFTYYGASQVGRIDPTNKVVQWADPVIGPENKNEYGQQDLDISDDGYLVGVSNAVISDSMATSGGWLK